MRRARFIWINAAPASSTNHKPDIAPPPPEPPELPPVAAELTRAEAVLDAAMEDTATELAASLLCTELPGAELLAIALLTGALLTDVLLSDELATNELLLAELALLPESAGGVPLKPVALEVVMANTRMPSFTTTFSGTKSTRLVSNDQFALPQRLVSN